MRYKLIIFYVFLYISIFSVLSTSAQEGGSTVTYKNLRKGQVVGIYTDKFICIREGDAKVTIGRDLNVSENLISLSKVINGSIDKSNKNLIIEALIAGLNDKSTNDPNELIRALEKTTGQNLGGDSTKWQEWWKKNRRVGKEK